MRNFSRDNKQRGRSNFKRRDFGKHRDSRPPQMHTATCSNCGKECQVPFKPTGDKPVYCRDCFAKINGNDTRKSFGHTVENSQPSFKRFTQNTIASSPTTEQFEQILSKLDQIIKLLTPNPTEKSETVVKKKKISKKLPKNSSEV